MGKLIVATFLILGFVFYEMSGGADFVPESSRNQIASAETSVETPGVAVTRSNDATLINVAAEATTVPEAEITQAVTEAIELDVIEEVVVAEVATPAPPPLDLRFVAGSRVNMRDGPGTTYSVLDTLDGGTEAEVLEVNEIGWAYVRVTETGQMGWMAERLLTGG